MDAGPIAQALETAPASLSGRVLWRGRSGRAYTLSIEPVAHFQLVPDALYVLASGPMVTWVGTYADLVEDAASRARFRLAMEIASAAFRLDLPTDDISRMTVAWDLEGAEREPARAVAA